MERRFIPIIMTLRIFLFLLRIQYKTARITILYTTKQAKVASQKRRGKGLDIPVTPIRLAAKITITTPEEQAMLSCQI